MIDLALAKRLAVLEAITHLHHSVGANLDLSKVSEILVEELRKIIRCTGCAVMLVEDKRVKVLAEGGFGQTVGNRQFAADTPAIRHVVEKRQPIVFGDVLAGPGAACLPIDGSTRSIICVPVKVDGEVRGIIHLDSPERNAFGHDDLSFVELLASEISIVFERSLDYVRVRSLSLRDRLTAVLNRRAFEEDLGELFAEAEQSQSPLSLILIDVDWFKRYNDHHGHPSGDDALVEVAARLRENVRGCDRVYRYGGEEFAVLLPGTSVLHALQVGERLREAIARHPFPGAENSQPAGRLTISLGLAETPRDATDPRGLLVAADSGLYRAKRGGRDQIRLGAAEAAAAEG